MGRNRWTVSLTGFRKNIIMNKFVLVIFAFGFSQIDADGMMGMGTESTTNPTSTGANGYGEDDGYGSGSGYGDGYGSGYGMDGYGSGYENGDDIDCCPMKYVDSPDPMLSGVYVNVGKHKEVPWFCNSQCVYVKEEDYDGSMDMTDGYGSGSGYGYGDDGYGEEGYGTTEAPGHGDMKKSRKTRGAHGPKVQKYCFKPSDFTQSKCYYDNGYTGGYGSGSGDGSGSGYGDDGYGEEGYGSTETPEGTTTSQ